jgi:toxin ParE1/3/4
MKPIRFLPEADDEFLAEIEYYSQERSGLGIRFQLAVEAAITRASAYPLAGAPVHKNIFRVGLKGFPFHVIYRIDPAQLLVVAIAHHKRQPDYWANRID